MFKPTIQSVSPIVASAFAATSMAGPALEMGQVSSLAMDATDILHLTHADYGGVTATCMHFEAIADGHMSVVVDQQIDTGMVSVLELMDLDSDGDLDLIVGEMQPDAVAVYINEGGAMLYNSLSLIGFTPDSVALAQEVISEEAIDDIEDAGLDASNALVVFSQDEMQLPVFVFNPVDAEPSIVETRVFYTAQTLQQTVENIGLSGATFEDGDFTYDNEVSVNDVSYLIGEGELVDDSNDDGGAETEEVIIGILIEGGIVIGLAVGTCAAITSSCSHNREQAIGNCQYDCLDEAEDTDEFYNCAICCWNRGNGVSCLCVPFNATAARLDGCLP